MKLLVLLAIAAAASAKVVKPREGEEGFLHVVDCLFQALDGGLPEAGIPNHNPLKLSDEVNITLDELFHGWVNIHDAYLLNITTYEVQDLEGAPHRDEFEYDFTFYWRELTFWAQFEADGTDDDDVHHHYANGEIKVILEHLRFLSTWESTLDFTEVEDFRMRISTEGVEVDLSGAGVYNQVLEDILEGVIEGFFEENKNTNFGEALAGRINDAWLAPNQTEKLEAIFDNCREDSGRQALGALRGLKKKFANV